MKNQNENPIMKDEGRTSGAKADIDDIEKMLGKRLTKIKEALMIEV